MGVGFHVGSGQEFSAVSVGEIEGRLVLIMGVKDIAGLAKGAYAQGSLGITH